MTSSSVSTKMPPTPISTTGPNVGSRRAPTTRSTPPDAAMRSTNTPSSGIPTRARIVAAAAAASAGSTPSMTPPASVLCSRSGETAFSATGRADLRRDHRRRRVVDGQTAVGEHDAGRRQQLARLRIRRADDGRRQAPAPRRRTGAADRATTASSPRIALSMRSYVGTARVVERQDRRRPRGHLHRLDQQRLAARVAQLGDAGGDGQLLLARLGRVARVAAEVARVEHGVDARIGDQRVGDVRERVDVGLARAGQVDRVRDLRQRQVRLHPRGRLRRQRRQLEAGVGEQVGGEHAVAAAVGQHRDSPAAAAGAAEQRPGTVDQLARRRHRDAARVAQRGGEHPRRTGQRPRVGGRRARADVGAPRLDHQRRLARLGQRPHRGDELGPVLRILHVARHDPRRLVVDQRPQHVGDGQVGLVADARRTARTPAARPSAAAPPRAPGCPTATPATRRRSAGRRRSRSARRACRAGRGSSARAAACRRRGPSPPGAPAARDPPRPSRRTRRRSPRRP